MYSRSAFVGRHRFEVVSGKEHAYLGLRSGFSIVDVDANGDLYELSCTDLGDVRRSSRGSSRSIVVRGDRVLVRRLWPAEFVEFDVKDPQQPRQTRNLFHRTMQAWP